MSNDEYQQRQCFENTGSKDLLRITTNYCTFEVLVGNKSTQQVADAFNRLLKGTSYRVSVGNEDRLTVNTKL